MRRPPPQTEGTGFPFCFHSTFTSTIVVWLCCCAMWGFHGHHQIGDGRVVGGRCLLSRTEMVKAPSTDDASLVFACV